jgi:hypothetical protein
MGRAYDENTVIALARSYQQATDWHLRHPPDVTSDVSAAQTPGQ